MHLVVGPHAPLVAVAVHTVVHVVDVGVLDISVDVGGLEHVGVGQVLAETADLLLQAEGKAKRHALIVSRYQDKGSDTMQPLLPSTSPWHSTGSYRYAFLWAQGPTSSAGKGWAGMLFGSIDYNSIGSGGR